MEGKTSSKIISYLLLAVFLLSGPTVLAQGKGQGSNGEAVPALSVMSRTPDPKDLPLPGQPVEITFQLLDAWDVVQGVRVLAVVDGRFLEVPVRNGYLNRNDQPEYLVQIPSPLSQLSYQILVPDGNNDYSWSRRFFVRRNCLPKTALLDLDADWRVTGQEQVHVCSERANALENELFAYERSLDLVRALRSELGVADK